jgi:hypothetical protein
MDPTVIIVPVLIVAAFVCIVLAARNRAEFEDKFPPISDAEFVAHCSPGTSPRAGRVEGEKYRCAAPCD